MTRNPVERNVVTRFLLGLAVLLGMMVGGAGGAAVFRRLGVPYADWTGVFAGAVVVFLAFAVVYTRYDASFADG